MNKKTTLSVALSIALLMGGCADLSKQQTGTLLGSAVGLGVGSLFGSGKGKIAAILVGGALGAFIGNQVGKNLDEKDRQSLQETTSLALEGNKSNYKWKSDHSNASGDIKVKKLAGKSSQRKVIKPKKVKIVDDLQTINQAFISEKSINVRVGPGTKNQAIASLLPGQAVTGIGMTDNNWMLISKGNITLGYVYAPLLQKTSKTVSDDAINLDDISDSDVSSVVSNIDLDKADFETEVVNTNVACKQITYDIDDGNGNKTNDVTKTCKASDGSWEIL